ncbi:SAM-dependent methyltransferase [Maribacter sp. 4U21]|uniref:methyltransferase domain-containing protein n=1 Tax=Maribacter sp. 4U21 TaxID=1889779 RepID=UPI000C151E59|nr:methyltransferase domain-containing protein [Maribacter sp. 4U21]PIB29194.1 SAM-dependent methyltransferase [Maribacter sp. 4U21]
MENQEKYWTARYHNQSTGWDIGHPSSPLKAYIDQLRDKSISVLIPGAGNAYEAEYLWQNGFRNIYVMDISQIPLTSFQQRIPDFPKEQLLQEDFFEHKGLYDLILEQTFFCSFVPTDENRLGYAKQMANLLKSNGKLVGVWFNFPLTGDMEKRPFGGDKALYLSFFRPYLKSLTFEICHNSIPPRQGKELFGMFMKK